MAGGVATPPMLIVFHDKYTIIDPLWHVRHLGEAAVTSAPSHTGLQTPNQMNDRFGEKTLPLNSGVCHSYRLES